MSTETEVSTPECAFGDERGGARRATPLQLWGSLFTISRFDVSFLMAQAMKQIAAFIVSMPSDRNASKASLPHGFDVICGPVVGIKRAVGGVHRRDAPDCDSDAAGRGKSAFDTAELCI